MKRRGIRRALSLLLLTTLLLCFATPAAAARDPDAEALAEAAMLILERYPNAELLTIADDGSLHLVVPNRLGVTAFPSDSLATLMIAVALTSMQGAAQLQPPT